MYNETMVRAVKKEIIDKYSNEFILSKLTGDKKYFYDNYNVWNFYVLYFNNVRINFNDDEQESEYDNLIEVTIKSKLIEIIFRWLKLKKIKFYIGVNQFKIKQTSIYLYYNKNSMKILFQILDFMKIFNEKYDNIGEII
jgi:hypothetical protein